MKTALTSFALICIVQFTPLAQNSESIPVTLSSAVHIFSLKPPEGWFCETPTANKLPDFATFYEKGKNFQSAPAVIYVHCYSMNTTNPRSVDDFARADSAFYQEHYPEIKPVTERPIRINENLTASCKVYNGKSAGSFDIYSYIDAGGAIVVCTLTAENGSGLEKGLRTLTELVRSYQFISKKQLPPKK